MDRRRLWLIAAVIVAGLWSWSQYRGTASLPLPPGVESPTPASSEADRLPSADTRPEPNRVRYPAFLPPEAHPVLDAIARSGPYQYRQDDGVFQNREGELPPRSRGYYREYTVPTPGSQDRGARRIVTGGDPPAEYYYTDDHYRSFRAFEVAR